MKQQIVKMSLLIFLFSAVLVSCEKEKDDNEEEVITTMKLTFVPVGGGATLEYQFDDPDGPGGAAPTQQEIILAPSRTYAVTIQLLNKTETPVEDVTAEVITEAHAHRFYYEPSAGSNITVTGLDNDPNGVPLGVTSSWTTGAVANGNIVVTLRHYSGNPPNKAAGDLVNSPKSSTDIAVTFVTKVQ